MVTLSSGSRPIDRTHCIDAVPDHVPPPMLIQQSTSIVIVSQQKNPNVGNMFDNRFSHQLPNITGDSWRSFGLWVFGSVGIGRLAHQTLKDQLQEAADMSAILTVVTLGMFYAVVAKTAFNDEGQQILHHLWGNGCRALS
ncbi:hypothetical protein Tco_0753049 [Tanacetum coccineum]